MSTEESTGGGGGKDGGSGTKVEDAHHRSSSISSLNERIPGYCDICQSRDRKPRPEMILQKCIKCGVLVHKQCYGIPTDDYPGFADPNFTCWACQSIGKTFKTKKRDTEEKRVAITQTERPMECVLCSVSDGVHAMHPLYHKHGPYGRHVVAPRKYPFQLAWIHTLCGLATNYHRMTAGCAYGCDAEGAYEGESEDEDNDSDGSQNSDLSKSNKKSGDSDIHHFVIPSVKKGEVDNIWTKTIKEHKQLKCIICGSKDNKSLKIPLQCSAHDENEFEEIAKLWKKNPRSTGEPCCSALHAGCAMWGRNNAGEMSMSRRLFYFPGVTEADDADERGDPVIEMYCTKHANDLIKLSPNMFSMEKRLKAMGEGMTTPSKKKNPLLVRKQPVSKLSSSKERRGSANSSKLQQQQQQRRTSDPHVQQQQRRTSDQHPKGHAQQQRRVSDPPKAHASKKVAHQSKKDTSPPATARGNPIRLPSQTKTDDDRVHLHASSQTQLSSERPKKIERRTSSETDISKKLERRSSSEIDLSKLLERRSSSQTDRTKKSERKSSQSDIFERPKKVDRRPSLQGSVSSASASASSSKRSNPKKKPSIFSPESNSSNVKRPSEIVLAKSNNTKSGFVSSKRPSPPKPAAGDTSVSLGGNKRSRVARKGSASQWTNESNKSKSDNNSVNTAATPEGQLYDKIMGSLMDSRNSPLIQLIQQQDPSLMNNLVIDQRTSPLIQLLRNKDASSKQVVKTFLFQQKKFWKRNATTLSSDKFNQVWEQLRHDLKKQPLAHANHREPTNIETTMDTTPIDPETSKQQVQKPQSKTSNNSPSGSTSDGPQSPPSVSSAANDECFMDDDDDPEKAEKYKKWHEIILADVILRANLHSGSLDSDAMDSILRKRRIHFLKYFEKEDMFNFKDFNQLWSKVKDAFYKHFAVKNNSEGILKSPSSVSSAASFEFDDTDDDNSDDADDEKEEESEDDANENLAAEVDDDDEEEEDESLKNHPWAFFSFGRYYDREKAANYFDKNVTFKKVCDI